QMRSRSCSRASTGVSRVASNRCTSAASRSTSATSGGALLTYELNGAPLRPQPGFPLRLVWDDEREVAERHHRDRLTLRWLSTEDRVPAPPCGRGSWRAPVPHGAALADGAARHS